MTKQHKNTWKSHERAVASAFGVKRNGNTGHATADVTTELFVFECKSWRTLPTKVTNALRQAEAAATDGQVAIAVIHQVGQRRSNDLVVMRWGDFMDWFGSGNENDVESVSASHCVQSDAE